MQGFARRRSRLFGRLFTLIRIGPYTFREATYDSSSDVLYATLAEGPTARREVTPEEHVCTLDAKGRLTGIAFMGARDQFEREGAVVVTLPTGERERVQGADRLLR